jgi:endonuclease G
MTGRLGAWAAIAVAALALTSGCGLDRLLGSDPHEQEAPAPLPERRGHHRKHPRASADRAPDAGSEAPRPPPADVASIHLALGTPTRADAAEEQLIIRPQYALAYNRARLGASWVSWQHDAAYLGGEHRHQGRFLADESLPAGWYRVQHEDYSGSGYDRGHMVRSEERSRSRADNDATFLLTNVLPQRHDLNAGPWLRLEEYCHTLAQREQRELYLTAGPIYGAEPPKIGHGISVPEAFYKIVVVLARGQGAEDVRETTRVIAVIMPNAEGILGSPWGKYRTHVAEIERRTGYRFLGRVPEDVRRALSSRVDEGPTG